MTSVFKLTRNSVDVDLLQAQNAGWRTMQWRPRTALTTGNRMPPNVTETVDILGDATSHDALATDFQDLDNYRWLAREYIKDRTQEHPVWLHAKADNETGERRALIHNISMSWRTEQVDENGLWVNEDSNAAQIRTEITRGPLWEDTEANSKTAGSNVSILAGAYDYSGTDVVGDAPARVDYLTLTSDGTTEAYTKAWIGFRSANKHGTLGNFTALWECEDGIVGTDTVLATDATASPGGAGDTKHNCDFSSTTTWAVRNTLQLDHVYTTNYSDMYGRFVVLLRAKVDASTTCEVKLRHSIKEDTNSYVEGPIVEVEATSWTMYNLGVVTIPIRDMHAFPLATWIDDYDFNDQLQVLARRTSGSGDLDMDCLTVIPADELFLYVDGLYTFTNGTTYRTAITQSPEGIWQVLSYADVATDYWKASGQVASQGLGVPIGDGRMYCVFAASDDGNTYSDTYDAAMNLFPRWYNLRGSE